MSEKPDFKSGTRHFLLGSTTPPFPYTGATYLSPYGQRIVDAYAEDLGKCLGGGVVKSRDLDDLAKTSPDAVMMRAMIASQISRMPAREKMQAAADLQSEWVAFEYGIVLSVAGYGYSVPVAWDGIESIHVSKKGFLSQDLVAKVAFGLPSGKRYVVDLQANAPGINTLLGIASAVGVPTAVG